MQFDKSQVVDLLRQLGNHDQADQASQQLPEKVDSEQHADLLQRFGLNPQDLLGKLSGGGIPGL